MMIMLFYGLCMYACSIPCKLNATHWEHIKFKFSGSDTNKLVL